MAGAIEEAIGTALARHPRGVSAAASILPKLLSLLLAPEPPAERNLLLAPLPGDVRHALLVALARCPATSIEVASRALGLQSRPPLADPWVTDVWARYAEVHGPIDAGQLVRALASERLEDEHVLAVALGCARAFDPASLVAIAATRGDELAQALLQGEPWYRERRGQGLAAVLEAAPPDPTTATAFVPVVLRAPRSLSLTLRRAVRSVPTEAITEHLRDRTWAHRAAAAEWLAERHDPAALPALERALAHEKHDEVLGALVAATEACGGTWTVDRAALERAGRRALQRGWPEELAFLTRETLPALSWRDGTVVDDAIVAGWIRDAHARREPRPPGLVRLAARELEPHARAAFARALFDRFVAWDTRAATELTPEQEDLVELHVEAGEASTREEVLARPDAKNFGLPTASAIACKGLLGLVAALGDDELVPELEAYVRVHRGFRAAQSRAMLTVLAHLGTPRATQALLRFAARFRTPGLRKEALLLADELAARRGWTLAELGDRTVPTAGLDERGRLELAYGTLAGEGEDVEVIPSRRFVARLDEHDELVLSDERGARLAKLPEPRVGEHEALAAREKKRYAAARKELRALLTTQRARLYEAMLAGRSWPGDDFATYFLAHPVLVRLVRRLIWTSEEHGHRATFRVAEDGTLVSADLDTVRLGPSAQVFLTHAALLDAEAVRAWRAHLDDHDTLPLFEQLDRPAVPPSAWSEGGALLGSRTRVPARALRGRAKQAGYVEIRGDGGYLERFERPFPTLGRALVLDTEGIEPMAPPDAAAEVIGLRWAERTAAGTFSPRSWNDAPEVVRREAWAELRVLLG